MDPNQYQPPQAPYNPAPPHPGQPSEANYAQPVAYDAQGRPLYAQPPNPQTVYFSRPINPIQQPISPAIQAKVEESRRLYPNLNLSEGEYIISAIKRHPIGLLSIWFIALSLVAAFMFFFFTFMLNNSSGGNALGNPDSLQATGTGIILLIAMVVAGGALVATYVYNNNRFYLTNESVVQEIQTSIFTKKEQTVSLSNIEDASYEQNGLFPTIFNYGRVRLSTEGDETTYRFKYVANPKKQVAILNNAVEAFKNGRPVDPNEED